MDIRADMFKKGPNMSVIDQNKLREHVSMLSDALFPYKSSVPEELKTNVQELVKEMANSDDLFTTKSRRSLLYLLAFADDDTRKLIFETAYIYFGSQEKALTVLFQDAHYEMMNELIQTSHTHTKSLLHSIAALDKEAQGRGLIKLMNIVSDTERGYDQILELVYSMDVSLKKRDFSDVK